MPSQMTTMRHNDETLDLIEDSKLMASDDSDSIKVYLDRPSYDVAIPDGETIVGEEKLETFLEEHLNKEMSIRYQSAKANSGAKWRTIKLVEYDKTHFRCTNPGDDRVFTYRRDRVLEIRA